MVAFMIKEPPHPYYPNDANATANAYRAQHEAYAAYAAANVGRFEELAGFTTHTFPNNHPSHNRFAAFDDVEDFVGAEGHAALRVTVEGEEEVGELEEFDWSKGLEDYGDDGEDDGEDGREDDGDVEVAPDVEEFEDPDRPFFGTRLGGYVVIKTLEYDSLLDSQHHVLESESLAADAISALSRAQRSHAAELCRINRLILRGCVKCWSGGDDHKTSFLKSVGEIKVDEDLSDNARCFLHEPSYSTSVINRLVEHRLTGDRSRSIASYVDMDLDFDVRDAYLLAPAPVEEYAFASTTANFASINEARNFYLPMNNATVPSTNNSGTETAGDNVINVTALTARPETKVVLDPGASRDMTNGIGLLSHYVAFLRESRVRINGAGGGTCWAEGTGTLTLTTTPPNGKTGLFVRKNVLFAPTLGHTLISTSSMMRAGWTFTNTTTTLQVFNPANVLVGLGHIGIQVICLMVRFPSLPSFPNFHSVVPPHDAKALTVLPLTGPEVAHERFGHLRGPLLSRAVELNPGVDLPLIPTPLPCQSCGALDRTGIAPCAPCELTKASRRRVSKLSARRADSVLDLLYSDLWGPSPDAALGGYKYTLGIIDDHTRWCWIAGLRNKSDTVDVLEPFFKWEERRHPGRKVKSFFSDKGGEYDGCRHLFARLGIEQHQATPYSHHKMGEIEWFWQRALEGVRAWLIRLLLPLWLWPGTVSAWTYVRNRLPTKSLNGQSPFFRKYGTQPDLSRLLAWGSLAYALIP
ncbi:hypothetical protein P7C70_g6116, partial [Phenoliferia sp. Uapishka_3]